MKVNPLLSISNFTEALGDKGLDDYFPQLMRKTCDNN